MWAGGTWGQVAHDGGEDVRLLGPAGKGAVSAADGVIVQVLVRQTKNMSDSACVCVCVCAVCACVVSCVRVR
jgi:hypothetical protein